MILWVALVVLDRLTKAWARGLREPVTLIPGVLGLRHVENTGVAFSMLRDTGWITAMVSLVFIALLLWGLSRGRREKFYHTGMMLMLCGAYSNMLDRFLYGTVTDMVEFLFVRFAVFNLADALLCLGCLLLMISLWREEKAWKRE